jgi:hypothetical protein
MRRFPPVAAFAVFTLAACAETPTAPLASEPAAEISATGLATSFQQAPRPGCGYGDDNHNHQAAPGLDPLNLRPGNGKGDPNHTHTAPPGQAPAGGGQSGDPMRGCKADPRGF